MSEAKGESQPARGAGRPISAFVVSLTGGAITLGVSLLVINTWFAMYSTNGTSFEYSQWLFVASLNLSAMEGLAFIIVGAACGILIIIGALLQHSRTKSRVKWGSILVLVGTVVGIPSTTFGWFFGGLLSALGAALGFGWRPEVEGSAHGFPS